MQQKMHRGEEILAEMQDEGQRIRPLRRALVEIFATRKLPLEFKTIQELLSKKKIPHHRVSLHRELVFLISWHVVEPVSFADGSTRYEFTGHGHHHHFYCTQCKDILDIHIEETDLIKSMKKLEETLHLSINRHALELFGLCKKCQSSL